MNKFFLVFGIIYLFTCLCIVAFASGIMFYLIFAIVNIGLTLV